MSKTKTGKTGSAAGTSAQKSLSSVKDGRVSKLSKTDKAKSKDVAKRAAIKEKDGKKLNKGKLLTPKDESESESESESEEGGDVSSDSENDDAESEAESESESKKAPAKSNGAAKTKGAHDSDSNSDSSDSDSDAEPERPASAKAAPAKKVDDDDSSGSSDSESDSDSEAESDSDIEETLEKPKAVAKKAVEQASSDEDSDDSDDSDESEAESAPKKRKADETQPSIAKKAKFDGPGEEKAQNGESKNLFVGNLSFGIDEDGLHGEFSEFGEISGCRIVYDRTTGRSKGFGYVEFSKLSEAIAAHDAKMGAMLDGRPLNVDYSQPRGEQNNRDSGNNFGKQNRFANDRAERYGDKPSQPSDTLFVGNISFEATNELVRETFEAYGTITRVSLPTDPESGALKGFGYVGFSSIDEAKEALNNLNGTDIAGRSIRLDFAQPRVGDGSPRGGRGGGRGGGFGGGGGGGFRGGNRGGFGGFRGGGDRGGRGGFRGGRGGASTNRGGFGDFKGKRVTF